MGTTIDAPTSSAQHRPGRYDRHDRLRTDQVELENPVENIWDKHEASGLVMYRPARRPGHPCPLTHTGLTA